MANVTAEWDVKTKDGIKYEIAILNFEKKIQSFKVGQELCSKTFKIEGLKFQIMVYPAGVNEKAKNHVGIYLKNLGKLTLDLHWACRILVKDGIKFIDSKHSLAGGACEGKDHCVSHVDCHSRKDGVLSPDGSLLLESKILIKSITNVGTAEGSMILDLITS